MIEFFESADDALFVNYHKFNSFLALKGATGDNPIDVMNRANRAISYINAEDKESAIKELSNLKMAYNFLLNNVSLNAYALACMVKTVNGKEMTSVTDAELTKKIKILESLGYTNKGLQDKNQTLKKKLTSKLSYFLTMVKVKTFPSLLLK